MKPLTKEEIKFIKETGWTPTVQQTDEWTRTIFADNYIPTQDAYELETKYGNDWRFVYVEKYAKDNYDVNLDELYKKCTDKADSITLENDATYLFYTFFTLEELEKLTNEQATKWLQDFKYYSGYRKWIEGNLQYVDEAISVYKKQSAFYIDEDDDNIWWFDGIVVNKLFKKYDS